MTAEGMLWAKVLRAPSIGAKIGTVDLSKAQSMPEVKIHRDGDFVAVAAPTLRDATRARDAIVAEWVEDSNVSTSDLSQLFGVPERGSAVYECAYIAHVPLEPRAALASWDGDRMTVYTGSQRPFGVKSEVATALGVPEDKVRVIVPDTGSGYGGKHTGDAAVEAARLSKALGVPIKLVWTREEEFRFAYCRPGGVAVVRGVLGVSGSISLWHMHNYNSGGSALETPYDVGEKVEQFHRFDSPIRQGSYRGLAATFNNFARESEMSELAKRAGMDPLEFRLAHLSDERLIAVLKACAEKFGWSTANVQEGRGIGIACGSEKGSYVATAVEITAKEEVRVLRATTAFECGKILNPALLRQQVDGAVLQGIGGALFERVDYNDGRCETARLSQYRLPRFSDVPQVETVLLDRPDLAPAGAGETPIMAIAPAIADALFTITGKRVRKMPLTLE
jgi:isoquinoline 1-oxidoreductase